MNKLSEVWGGLDPFNDQVRIDSYLIIIIFAVALFLLILAMWLFKRRKREFKDEKELKELSLKFIGAARSASSNDKFMDDCLDLVCPMVKSQSYGFYKLDPKKGQFILKGVRYMTEDLKEIGPDYSGLAPYKKEEYLQPISLQNKDMSDAIRVVKDGIVPILEIPFQNHNALIRICPVKNLSKVTKHKLEYFAITAGQLYDLISEADKIKNKINNVIVSDSAVDRVVSTLGTKKGLIYTLIGLFLKKTEMESGFYIRKLEEKLEPICFVSAPQELETHILEDAEGIKDMVSLTSKDDIVVISKNEPDFYKLPPYFTAYQIDSVVLINIIENNEKIGVVVLFNKEGISSQLLNTALIKTLQYTKNRFQELISVNNIIKILSETFQNSMQGLMLLLDNIQPYTVGYSELMARYSYIIAEELGLPEDEKKSVYLAASLSNIGVVGLSNDLYFKTERYSELEYEAMKFHAESGAKIIESTLGNKQVGDIVRYHHERIDGLGYPMGLKRDEIPLGARILAVVQYFLAMLIGRPGRDPVDFNDVLKSLELSVDTQLDRDCVDALIRWFHKKRSSNPDMNRSLGNCWEMRCSTLEVCGDCPAYMKKDLNCWEYENKGIQCSKHGNSCKSCFVRTEVMGR